MEELPIHFFLKYSPTKVSAHRWFVKAYPRSINYRFPVDKAKRHFAIKEIIQSKSVHNQEELCVDLKKRGFEITQATLSRDLKELGVIRTHSGDRLRYALTAESEERKMKSLIGFEVTSIVANETMIVIRTLPGRAPGVASFLDSLHNPHLLGTVAGDDTVVVPPINDPEN